MLLATRGSWEVDWARFRREMARGFCFLAWLEHS